MMSLPRSCQNEGRKEAGRGKPPPPLVSAPESALGSHSCVALSSAQANSRLHHSHPPLAHKNVHRFRVDFYLTQRYPFRVDFYLTQRAWIHRETHTLKLFFLRRIKALGIKESASAVSRKPTQSEYGPAKVTQSMFGPLGGPAIVIYIATLRLLLHFRQYSRNVYDW